MARPPEKPLKMAGKWGYGRFMSQDICFPAETMTGEIKSLVEAINANPKTFTFLSIEQHAALLRFLTYQVIFIGRWK